MENLFFLKRLRADTHGQDLIEYALMAAFVAFAAGAIVPGVIDPLAVITAKLGAISRGVEYLSTPTPISQTGRIICAVGAIFFLGLIIWRRNKQEEENN